MTTGFPFGPFPRTRTGVIGRVWRKVTPTPIYCAACEGRSAAGAMDTTSRSVIGAGRGEPESTAAARLGTRILGEGAKADEGDAHACSAATVVGHDVDHFRRFARSE
jgi:hypothetical protein